MGQFQSGKELHGTISVRQGAALGDYSSARSCMEQIQYGKLLQRRLLFGKEPHGAISVRQGAVLGDTSSARSCVDESQYGKELH